MDKEHPKTKRRRRRLPPAKIAAALVLLAVYGVYRLIQRRKNRE